MSELNFNAIHDELTKGFISREYQILNPTMRIDLIEKEAIILYQRDGVFHNRVSRIVSEVMRVIENSVEINL